MRTREEHQDFRLKAVLEDIDYNIRNGEVTPFNIDISDLTEQQRIYLRKEITKANFFYTSDGSKNMEIY